MAALRELRASEKSWWCPGCGDFGVLAALQKALVELSIEPEKAAVVSGIGSFGKIGNYNSYNLHTVHGWSLAAATASPSAWGTTCTPCAGTWISPIPSWTT